MSAHNSDLSQQVASLNAELVKEHKGTDALKAELAALKSTVASPPAATPAAAAAAAGGASRTPLGRTAGGRSAKRKRTEAAPEDEEMHGRSCPLLLVLVVVRLAAALDVARR